MKIVMSMVLLLMLSGTVHAGWGPSGVVSRNARKDNNEYQRVLHEQGLKPEQEEPRKEQREPQKENSDTERQNGDDGE